MLQSETTDNFDVILEQLNVQFQSIVEDYRLLPPEEQEQQRGSYYQVQYMCHSISMIIIDRLMDPTEKQNVPAGQDPPSAGVETGESSDQSANEQNKGAVGGQSDPVDVKPGYLDFCKILDPIFTLEPMNEVTEQSINIILIAVTNAAESAKLKGFTIEHEARTIIAYVHRLLDITSQALWSW